MHLQYMSSIEDRIQVLKEWIIYYLESYAEMVAECVEDATALHLWRIWGYFVVIVAIDLSIDVVLVQLFTLFALYEEQVYKI